MNFIRNFQLISEKISTPIREIDFKFVSSIRYYIDYNKHYDEVSFLEVGYVLEPALEKQRYQVLLGFSEVTLLNLSGFGGSFNQLVGFKINDMKDRNWEANQRYHVHDYENDVMSFYCKTIEVLSIKTIS
ncbi:hypothetical protein SAMN04487969_108136 [Paenibacillus algorifonticola]|uniref:Immunity protein 50 n=1 Tax=Paenibacillus algorifonticola TaxID=684063 RepID=A0A1I2E233_9BACL|nr:hypothetical protein [Paenibacillus algorifonticola]SFE86934.1 hypothetical protein SAMN04487969_108136 [Paenibacillus algorifonticola]